MANFDAIRMAMLHGIDLSNHETVRFSDFEIGTVDVILTSTSDVKNHLKEDFPDFDIFTIREYVGFDDINIHEPVFGDCIMAAVETQAARKKRTG